MNTTYQSFLTKLLEAIDFKNDKEQFVGEFIKDTQLETLLELIETLPADKQTAIKEQLSKATKPEEITQLMNDNFTQEQLQESFTKNANEAIKGLLETLKDTFTDEQRQKVVQLLQSLSQEEQKDVNKES
jgi:Mg/Co/Ni transporter MgtE